MTYDGSNRKQIRQREKASKLAEANRIAYVRRIMSDQVGREWLYDLLSSCAVFGEPFVRGSADATAYNLGRQAVGKQLFADAIVHCPSEYLLMMQESAAKDVVRNIQDDENAEVEEHNKPETEYDPI